MSPLQVCLLFSSALFCIGLIGALARSNTILVLLGIELMLNAANLNFIAFWRFGPNSADAAGVMFVVFSIAIAAGAARVQARIDAAKPYAALQVTDKGYTKAEVEQIGKLDASMTAGNGANAAAAVQSLTAAGQALVAPNGQAGRQLGLLPETFPRPDHSSVVSGSAECSATACTFNNYGDDTTGNSWLIDGTVSKTGDTTAFDLTYKVTTAAASLDWTIDGSVLVNATTIDGNVHNHGVTAVAAGSNNPGVNVTWDTGTDFNKIALDAQGCATSGKLTAYVAYDVNAGGQGGSFDVEGTASFGPACGQISGN